MVSNSLPSPGGGVFYLTPVLERSSFRGCHIRLPDTPKPLSAIIYKGNYYSYVRCFPDLDSAQRGAGRMIERGNIVVLTQTGKGLVLWVFEADAQLAVKPLTL